ncbi:MAG TPA: hypothetical protein DHU96_35205 [Actinobacteria bacterium]|nr:hypothetical protein [Actinomycetota bacterium]
MRPGTTTFARTASSTWRSSRRSRSRARVQPAGEDQYTLTGDLTIKGTTHPVTLDVRKYGEFNDPGMMWHRIAYSARASSTGRTSA